MKRRAFYIGMLLIVLSWGFNYVITKIGVGHFSPADFVFWRFLLTAVLTLPWMVKQYPSSLKALAQVAVLGVIGVTLYQLAFTTALRDTLAANVAFLFDLSPLMTLAGQRILHLRRSAPRMFLGAGVSLLGVLLLVGASAGGSVVGDGFALLAALLWAVFTLLTDRFHLPISGIALTGWMSVFGTAAVIPFMTPRGIIPRGFGVWGPLGYTVLFVTIMGLSLWQNAVMSEGGGKASLYLYIIPVIAAVAGWAILGEAVNLFEGAGAVLIIAGVSIAEGLWHLGRLRGRPLGPQAPE